MSSLNPDTSIGSIVADQPSFAAVFEQLGIDYCCGGDRSLARACAEEGLDPTTVIRLLEANIGPEDLDGSEAQAADWTRVPLDRLIEHIETTHHAYLRRELPRLQELLEKVAHVHGTDAPWLGSVKAVFEELKPSMEAHIQKEENIVFPFIRDVMEDGATPSPEDLDGDPIALMEEEHDETGHALKRMRSLSHDYTMPEWGCNSFRAVLDGLEALEADTHEHVHKENSILFPRARQLM